VSLSFLYSIHLLAEAVVVLEVLLESIRILVGQPLPREDGPVIIPLVVAQGSIAGDLRHHRAGRTDAREAHRRNGKFGVSQWRLSCLVIGPRRDARNEESASRMVTGRVEKRGKARNCRGG
jgi:hypothetical protein